MNLHEFDKPRNSILIVDDEPINISVLTHILGTMYTLYVAKSGQDAIEVATELKPDLVLLDVVMPEMDGFAVIAILKKQAETKDIPVIFVTGLSGSDFEEKGLALGAADYIGKPFVSAIVKLRVKNQLQLVNQMRLIEKLSLTDALTGIANRRQFDNNVNREWQIAIREKRPLSLFILDIDHFKLYNDTYGHFQGDEALKFIAGAVKSQLKRDVDFVARLGGEEFAVLLSHTDEVGAKKVAENIRRHIETSVIPSETGVTTQVTISIGINSVTPKQDTSIHDFLLETDAALYEAKKAGRNRICMVAP